MAMLLLVFSLSLLISLHDGASATDALNITGSSFSCAPLSSSTTGPPSSVHQLRPTDIRVIGAMGNSLTAGFGVLLGAQEIFVNLTDFRGLAWSIGGDANLSYVTTLPNILRQYSPDLYGFSMGETPITDFIDLPNTRLNVAMSGALSRDMLGQAQELVRKMQESPEVDFDNDWKLVTIFIGFNDVCQSCTDPMGGDPDSWAEDIGDALDYLQENSPRTFVNLVQMFPVGSLLRDTVTNSVLGDLCRPFSALLCPCGPFGPQSIGNNSFDEAVIELQENIADLVDGDRFEASEDFTVVLQPFLSGAQLEEVNGDVDISFLASDCVHFGPSGSRNFAIGLWNNMFERVGAKTLLGNPAEAMEILCPTDEQPFLFTSRNSGSTKSSVPLNSAILLMLVMVGRMIRD